MDKGNIEHYLVELHNRIGDPLQLANQEVAEELFPYVKEKFPRARLVVYDICQWIIVSERARAVTLRQLRGMRAKHEQAIAEIKQAENELIQEVI